MCVYRFVLFPTIYVCVSVCVYIIYKPPPSVRDLDGFVKYSYIRYRELDVDERD